MVRRLTAREIVGTKYSLRKCIRPLVGDFSPGLRAVRSGVARARAADPGVFADLWVLTVVAGYCAVSGSITASTWAVPPLTYRLLLQSEYPAFLIEISCFPAITVTFKGVLPAVAPSI